MKTLTQKQIKNMVNLGLAQDITKAKSREVIPTPYTTYGYSAGIYGCNGKLLEDENGNLYAIIGATSALYIF